MLPKVFVISCNNAWNPLFAHQFDLNGVSNLVAYTIPCIPKRLGC